MKTVSSTNYKIDWVERASPVSKMRPMPDFDRILADRKRYFKTLRRFLCEIEMCKTREDIYSVFIKYNIHFVDVDEFERVNVAEPETGI